jgi:Tol biopolymer transport system component
MRRLTIIGVLAGLVALAAMSAAPAGANPPGANGQILFTRHDPLLDKNQLYTVNPDGSHEHQVLTAGCPRWSPDGALIAAACVSGLAPRSSSAAIIDPDDGSYRILPRTDPDRLETHCPVWSPDAARLACEGYGETDPSLNGVYTIRTSDGADLTRVTSNPGGADIPGDYSPNGKRLVFGRVDSTDLATVGLYVVRLSDNRLRQLTPAGTLVGESGGDWSPQGNEIVFSQRVTPDARSSLWVVHSDGSGLHEIAVQAQPACGGASSDPSSQGCFGPRWSPDGKKIVFARGTSSDNDSNIYTVNADGTDLTQVTHGGADSSPDWGTHPLSG